jgi:hypothetical protein
MENVNSTLELAWRDRVSFLTSPEFTLSKPRLVKMVIGKSKKRNGKAS